MNRVVLVGIVDDTVLVFCPLHAVFEFLEGGEVLDVPTETPLDKKSAWLAFRDVVLGLEYRECWPMHETLSALP